MPLSHTILRLRGRKSSWRWLPASLAVLALAGCGGSSGSDSGGRAVDRIVYVKGEPLQTIPKGESETPAVSDVFLMNTDGSGRTQVNEAGKADYYEAPRLSQDGSKIVVLSNRDNCGGVGCTTGGTGYRIFPKQVWMLNADGSGAKRLTTFSSAESIRSPALSPDNSKLYYTTGEGFWVTDVHTLNRVKITDDLVGSYSLSPDGTKIAYAASGPITIMNADGTGKKVIATNAYAPSFSPDGSRIIYLEYADRPWGTESPTPRWISVINADGTGKTKLTDVIDGAFSAAFSRDGKKIIVKTANEQSGGVSYRVVTMDLDGTQQTSVPVDTSRLE